MTRYCLDSTIASAIPPEYGMVAGYCDGLYRWSDADWARFPFAVKVRIAVNPATNDGHVLDVEPGNWDAAASVDWTIMRRAAGLDLPTIYAGNWAPGYTVADVLAAHDARGVARPLIWVANYDGVATIPDGCIAKQYADAGMLGINADQSVVADYWPGVDAVPSPGPQPQPDGGPYALQADLDRLNAVLAWRLDGKYAVDGDLATALSNAAAAVEAGRLFLDKSDTGGAA